jgi:hypothetical protein
MQNFINQLSEVLETKYILTQDEDKAPYLTDWRKRFTGKALPLYCLALVMKLQQCALCNFTGQGGYTGFCGGATRQ